MTAPLVVRPLQAYRYWRLDREGGQPVLRSLYYATLWPAHGPLQASCEAAPCRLAAWVRQVLSWSGGRRGAPNWGCQGGIYACTGLDPAAAVELSPQPQRGLLVESWPVVGAVLLWGHVIQHEHGYRAEYARPLTLCAPPAQLRGRETRALIEAVAHRYAIELESDVTELTRR